MELFGRKVLASETMTTGFKWAGGTASFRWTERVNLSFAPNLCRISAIASSVDENNIAPRPPDGQRVYGIMSNLNGYDTSLIAFRGIGTAGTDVFFEPLPASTRESVTFQVVELSATNTWTPPTSDIMVAFTLSFSIEFYRLE